MLPSVAIKRVCNGCINLPNHYFGKVVMGCSILYNRINYKSERRNSTFRTLKKLLPSSGRKGQVSELDT